ncbi:MAG: hypothetical protein Q8O76_12165 [Chloroflexota bacterium]|nr:hypothetical protein [Chloroflexota bacterium]
MEKNNRILPWAVECPGCHRVASRVAGFGWGHEATHATCPCGWSGEASNLKPLGLRNRIITAVWQGRRNLYSRHNKWQVNAWDRLCMRVGLRI